MPHQKQNPRTIVLPSGKGIVLHRLASSVMGVCGQLDPNLDAIPTIGHMEKYRFYTLDHRPDGQPYITRKVRVAR